MEPFPPIFAYVIFGITWLIQVIFTLLVITIPAAGVVAILEIVLLFFWMIIRFGPGKTFSRFSSFKNNKKFMKRFITQSIGGLIPIVDLFPWSIWFIYKEYKEEVKEFRNKELGISDEDSDEGYGLFKKLAIGAAVVATGGAAAAVVGEATLAGASVDAMEAGIGSEIGMTTKVGQLTGNTSAALGKNNLKNLNKKTIEEEIGGVKTGLNREDYDSGIKNYGDFDTYSKENKEKEAEKNQKAEEVRKNDDAKRIQGIKVEKDLRADMLETARRRFGENSDQVKGMQEESIANNPKDNYREIV